MKTGGLLLLSSLILLSGLCSGGGVRSRDDQPQQQQKAKPFHSGYEYAFVYNGQIASGLASTSEGDAESEQKAATRIQAQAKISFTSEHQATLRLEQPRIGQANKRIEEPQQVQPMGMFESKQIQPEQRQQLQLPCQFIYTDGVVERIHFHPEDSTWSKNIKRAVLNLIQLNLKRNNAQGLQGPEEINDGQDQTSQEIDSDSPQRQLNQAFTIPETSVEGQCQTTYAINSNKSPANRQQERSAESDENDESGDGLRASPRNTFNVTKSINFKQCKKIGDVAFGFQTQQPQPQCAQCQHQWYKQQQKISKEGRQQQQEQQANPCDQCDPKEVKEQKLDRTTVFRYVLSGKPEMYGIQRAELISQYVFKNLRAEADNQYGSAMHTVVAAELVFRSSQKTNQQQQKHQFQQGSSVEETLLYDNKWDVEEKRFYMYGDDEFNGNSPFKTVPNKAEQAHSIIRKLVQSASDKANGIEYDNAAQLQRLTELLRMCTVDELQHLQKLVRGSGGQSRTDAEQQKCVQIMADALAIAGTRNTIYTLVDQIVSHNFPSSQAVQCLQSLNGLPAPSDSQAEIVLRLCKSEVAHRSAPLKQACWLTFGSLVGELCKHKTQKNAQQSVFGAQSGFTTEEICPQHKKDNYKKVLFEQYQNARSIYEKVLAMKTIGNAGLDTCVSPLEQIIQNGREARVVRIQAIDALRRLRVQMPRRIQRVLLPLFQNGRDHPQVRMAAFSMIMHTTPEQHIVDQIAYTLTKERSQHVQAFVYTTMKSLARSQIPAQQQLVKHLRNALKVANVDDLTLRASNRYHVPIYSQEHQEGVVLNLASVFSGSSMLPAHLSASIDSLINGEYEMNSLKIGFSQQEVDSLYEKVMQKLSKLGQSYSSQQKTRGQRSSQRSGDQELREIFSGLGIKRRSSYRDSQENEQSQPNEPFAMINIRVGDVDQVILPLDQQTFASLKQMVNGEKSSLSSWSKQMGENRHFRLVAALNLNEKSAKVPTSLGVPLRILQSLPTIAAIEGQLKMSMDSGSRLDFAPSVKTQLSIHPSIAVAHVQKMEAWLWPIQSTGVECTQGLEMNVPIQAELQMSQEEGVKASIKPPQNPKTRVFGLHTLPVTFTREYDTKINLLREPKLKTIHNTQLEQLQRDVRKVVGEHTFGVPFHVRGHYHVPADVTDYKQIVQLLMATQNHIHITFEPTADTPREIQLSATGKAFQKVAGSASHNPELNSFYSNSGAKFEQVYPEDFEDMQLESHSQRREKLTSFLNNFQPARMYRHELKLSAQTVGGRKQCKAHMQLEGACDPAFQYCKMLVNIQRSPMYASENTEWTLKSKIQSLAPSTVSSIQQLDQLESKNQKFVAQAEAEWGTDRKQTIQLRVQGESAKNKQWRDQIEDERQPQQSKYLKKRTAFLNKYDVVAEYKLQPSMQNIFSRGFELLKAYNFWNTQSQLQDSSRDGQVHATFVLDPIGQRHANISVKTPTQMVKIESVPLPLTLRPFPLIRRQDSDKPTHSVSQLVNRFATKGRAECNVDGKSVETFDGVLYKAPISTCYSVLAKDCTNEEQPQFAVLMKNVDKNGQEKKIKVITPEQTIECQPKDTGSNGGKKLRCKVNGKTIDPESQDSNELVANGAVEYNDQQTDVTINVEGVSVRFGCWCSVCKCQKAWIKISNEYKNGQCGLCGHYDDQPENEWRMNNDESTNDLAQFHQSFSWQNNDECSPDEQKSFYSKKDKFAPVYDAFDEENNESEVDREWRENAYGDSDEWGTGKSSNRALKRRDGRDSRQQQNTQEPVKQTKVIEYNSKICFSLEPVKQCPADTAPESSLDSSDEDKDQAETKKTQFACLSRSSVEARRLQRQARRGIIIDIPDQPPSFVENVKEPLRCIQY